MRTLLAVMLLVSSAGCTRNASVYERLAEDVFHSYHPHIWPAKSHADSITVSIGLAVYRLVEMNEKDQSVTTSTWIHWEWFDNRLKWNVTEYDNITELHTTHSIWKPDITLYGDIREEERPVEKYPVILRHDGHISFKANIIYVTYCKQNAIFFPFDRQMCHLKFGSWTYHGYQINATNSSIAGDVSNYISNGEWDVMGLPVVVTLVYYTCCPEPYPDVTFTLVLQRRGTFYVINLFLPVFFMVLLAIGSFYLPAESGEKASLAVTIFLSQMVYNVVVIQHLPTQSEKTPLVAQYLVTVQVLMALSTTLNVSVIHLYHRGQHGWLMPDWVKKFFFYELGTYMRFSQTVNLYKQRKLKIAQAQDILKKGEQLVEATALTAIHKLTRRRVHPVVNLDKGDQNDDEARDDFDEDGTSATDEGYDAEFIRLQRNILVQLKYMLRSSTERTRRAFFRSEWALLAMIIDRMLFYATLIITVVFVFVFAMRYLYML